MALAVPTGRVFPRAARDTALNTPVGPFPLRGKAAITPHLLVVAKAVSLGDLGILTALNPAAVPPAVILALWREMPMAANLLVMTRAVSGGAGFLDAAFGLTDRAPSTYERFHFSAKALLL